MNLWHFKNDLFYLDLRFVEKLDWHKVLIWIWFIYYESCFNFWIVALTLYSKCMPARKKIGKPGLNYQMQTWLRSEYIYLFFIFRWKISMGLTIFQNIRTRWIFKMMLSTRSLIGPQGVNLIGLEWQPISAILKILIRITDL